MVHGITEYQMREMNSGNISYRSIAVLLFTTLLSSCLKETAVPIESTFTARCQTKVHAYIVSKQHLYCYSAQAMF